MDEIQLLISLNYNVIYERINATWTVKDIRNSTNMNNRTREATFQTVNYSPT